MGTTRNVLTWPNAGEATRACIVINVMVVTGRFACICRLYRPSCHRCTCFRFDSAFSAVMQLAMPIVLNYRTKRNQLDVLTVAIGLRDV